MDNLLIPESFQDRIIGKNKRMRDIFRLIESAAACEATVLLIGETGTGKELIAQTIHELSSRKEKPFIKADCSLYDETMLASELFGHDKGAFPDAVRRKKGRFELADGGTIYLDEIGEIPLNTQLLLQRALEEKKFERVGGEETIGFNVRVIAATSKDLKKQMINGQFREDLYYLLNVVPILVPPLCDRREDIALLSHYFLEFYSVSNRKRIKTFSEEAMKILMDYDWPGNVQELQNAIEHTVVLAGGDTIVEADLPTHLTKEIPKGNIEFPILIRLKETTSSEY
jgi:transcriptional regulator with GAF, ATPase, and Fis domain